MLKALPNSFSAISIKKFPLAVESVIDALFFPAMRVYTFLAISVRIADITQQKSFTHTPYAKSYIYPLPYSSLSVVFTRHK